MKKINVFWASLGSALGLLLILYIMMVWPKMGERTKVERQLNMLVTELNGAVAETPGKPDIDGWKKYREEAKRAYKDITKFYADNDKALERWFPGMENPNRGSFMTKYRDEGAKLEAELLKKGCQVGLQDGDPEDPDAKDAKKKRLGFNWEALEIPHWNAITQAGPEEEQKVLGELQKRFWARQRVANLVLTSGVKASRVLDFRFFKRLHPAVSNPPWDALPQAKEGITYQGLGGEGGNAFRGGFQEFDLPNELGKTLTFGAAIELPYSEVAKALREVLSTGGQPGANEALLISLVGAHVTIRTQNEPYVTYEYKEGDKQDEAAKREKALQDAKARDVLLTFTCQIIDFDPSKVKNFDAPGGQ